MRKKQAPATTITEMLTGLASQRPQPTRQQQKVVDGMTAGGDQVCIAYAGSGKTGTGVEVAHQLPGKGYFLLFNRSARKDAAGRLPPTTRAETGHSLAFREVIEPSPGYTAKLAGTLNPDDGARLTGPVVAELLQLKSSPDPELNSRPAMAMAILETVRAFQVSADRTPKPQHVPDTVIPVALRTPENRSRALSLQERIADHAQRLWTMMANERHPAPIEHDSYLKLLELRQHSIGADFWILDEYQDTTPVVSSLIDQQSGQKLYIGDPRQQIYAWRGAINALDTPIRRGLPVHYLNESFRFNHQIARLATLILRAVGEDVPVKGQQRNLMYRMEQDPHTLICRNNLSILKQALRYHRMGYRVSIEGGIQPAARARLMSALALFEQRTDDIKVSAMREMGSWSTLVSYVTGMEPPIPDYLTLIELVETYQGHLPGMLTEIEAGRTSRSQRRINLITAHKAKGRQWPFVELDEDLAIPDNLINKLVAHDFLETRESESLNLLYVALTRAELGIELPSAIQKNFALLHKAFHKDTDKPTTFVADTQVPISDNLEPILRRHRTQAFIQANRRYD